MIYGFSRGLFQGVRVLENVLEGVLIKKFIFKYSDPLKEHYVR